MRRSPALWCVLLAALLACGPVFVENHAFAEEEEEAELPEDGAPISDAEAKELAKTLSKVAKRRKAGDILPVLDRVGLRSHPDLHKPLFKLVTHDQTVVAVRALEILRAQVVEGEKDRAKLAKLIWKYGWTAKKNDKRFAVKGNTILAYVKQIPGPLEKSHYKEVERMWRWCVGNPHKDWGPGLVAICEYVSETNDKRLCRMLAENIENPQPTDVNSPTNPPAAWWKKRWELWKESKAACIETLDDLTGETFKTVEDARKWFEANEKEFGFVW